LAFSFNLIFWVVVSALGLSLFDALRKHLSAQYSVVSLAIWLLVAQSLLFVLLLPFEAVHIDWQAYWWPGSINIILNLFADVCFLLSVQAAPLSVTVPLLSFTPLFASLGSWLILGEQLTVSQWAGMALIVVGAVWLTRQSGHPLHAANQSQLNKAVALMILTALFWAIAPVLDKICLGLASPNLYAALQLSGIAALLYGYLRWRGQPIQAFGFGRPLGVLALATVAFGVGLIFQFKAILLMPVGLFEALKRCINLLCILVLGWVLFQEPITRVKVWATGLMMLGVVVLLLG